MMESRSQALAGLRILIVEDEVMLAMMIEQMVQDFGCTIVEVVGTIEKALACVRQNALDGVLLDMNLHGRKTIAVVEELIDRSVPFLLVTGYGAQLGDPPGIKAAPRLMKPFSQEDLGQRMTKEFVAAR
jgi:CheY-like chemotaxis protein